MGLTIRNLRNKMKSLRGGGSLKRRDLVKQLEAAGYRKARDDGDHTVYKKSGSPAAIVPRHREINELTANNILKQAGLK